MARIKDYLKRLRSTDIILIILAVIFAAWVAFNFIYPSVRWMISDITKSCANDSSAISQEVNCGVGTSITASIKGESTDAVAKEKTISTTGKSGNKTNGNPASKQASTTVARDKKQDQVSVNTNKCNRIAKKRAASIYEESLSNENTRHLKALDYINKLLFGVSGFFGIKQQEIDKHNSIVNSINSIFASSLRSANCDK